MLATPPLVGEQYECFCNTSFWTSSKNSPYEGYIKPPVELVVMTGPAFFLREARHDGQQNFAFAVEGPDVFFLKIDLDAVFLQLPDGGQGVDRVPRKAADRLGDDQVDLAVHRIRDHAFEALAVLGAGARDALVSVHGYEFPIVPALDVVGVVIDLRLIARELIVVISGDASILSSLIS